MTQPKRSNSSESLKPEAIGASFVNELGETISPELKLLVDPVRGEVWQKWAEQYFPKDVFRGYGLFDREGSEAWQNVIEHSIFIAASSQTLADQLQARGAQVNRNIARGAGMVHDVTKRR